MIPPSGDRFDGPQDDDSDETDDNGVQRALDRFHGRLNNVEGHKRRLIDAAGWWIIRAVFATAFVVLLVFGRTIEAGLCALLFGASFLFR